MPAAPPLIGRYVRPSVHLGERVGCLFRECECTVTSMSDGRIPWPRAHRCDGHGGASGLWVNAELERAIRTESAAALRYWFGASQITIWQWRKHFGVSSGADSALGTRCARSAAAAKAGALQRTRVWTATERAARSERAKRLGLRPVRWTPERGGWAAEHLALLGTDHDKVIAQKIGRTRSAVKAKRQHLGIPVYSGWPGHGPAWTAAEIARLGTDSDAAVARAIGRTTNAVTQKRKKLKVPAARTRSAK